jgi:hypothetical protein
MQKVLEMSDKRYNKLVEAGLKQAESFDWDKAAKKTVKILENAAR